MMPALGLTAGTRRACRAPGLSSCLLSSRLWLAPGSGRSAQLVKRRFCSDHPSGVFVPLKVAESSRHLLNSGPVATLSAEVSLLGLKPEKMDLSFFNSTKRT